MLHGKLLQVCLTSMPRLQVESRIGLHQGNIAGLCGQYSCVAWAVVQDFMEECCKAV